MNEKKKKAVNIIVLGTHYRISLSRRFFRFRDENKEYYSCRDFPSAFHRLITN